MDGVLVVDKPPGPSSHGVVSRVRRALGLRRIGHTGTLDPLATGVLPLVIGRATRLSSFLTGAVKEYEAGIRFGAETPTFDAEGRVRMDPATGSIVTVDPPPVPPGLSSDVIERALQNFRGSFEQVPPPFSARKTAGVRAYKRARQNEPVERRAVPVVVHSLSLEHYADGLATVRLTCSAGFYVRSLAHDLGAYLGCGAYLASLRRTRAGDFSIDQAIALENIEKAGVAAVEHILALERLLPDIPVVVLNDRGVRRASHGNDLMPGDMQGPALTRVDEEATGPATGRRWRLLSPSGTLLGIAEEKPAGVLHPVVVLV